MAMVFWNANGMLLVDFAWHCQKDIHPNRPGRLRYPSFQNFTSYTVRFAKVSFELYRWNALSYSSDSPNIMHVIYRKRVSTQIPEGKTNLVILSKEKNRC